MNNQRILRTTRTDVKKFGSISDILCGIKVLQTRDPARKINLAKQHERRYELSISVFRVLKVQCSIINKIVGFVSKREG